jgi:hypothetical protein
VDHRANSSDGTPMGRNNEIAWSALFHNPPGSGSLRGIMTGTSLARGGDAMNNLSYFNKGGDFITNFTERENFKNAGSEAPEIADPGYEFGEPDLVGSNISEQWRNLFREIRGKIMPTKGGNLHGKGYLDPAYYHATAADDPEVPSDPDDHTKLHWFRLGKLTPAPDIGAVQYQEIFPPETLRGNPSTQPLPEKLPAPVFKLVKPLE